MTTRHKTIGEMLKDRREQLEHTQAEAIRQIGTSRESYPKWESGHSIPGDEWIKPISIYLDMDEEDLALQRYYEKRDRRMPGYLSATGFPTVIRFPTKESSRIRRHRRVA